MPRPQLAEFMRRMEPNSVAILPSAREVTRSNDTEFRFRQDSDFYYLTGFNEPDSVAVIAPGRDEKFTLFVRPRDPEKEIWNGRRAGVEGAKESYGADEAFPVEEFDAKLTELLDGAASLYYRLGGGHAELDQTLIRQLSRMRMMGRRGVRAPQTIIDPGTLIHEMRLVKSDEEVALMQRSADIAAEAHREAMRAARPGMKEYELDALIEYVFRRNGSAAPAYNSIVGSGANATILHYVDNDAELKDGDMLLVDAGAEYEGFASDITRTFPVSGRFTKEQADIYNLVFVAQEAGMRAIKPGARRTDADAASVEVIKDGLLRLGLITERDGTVEVGGRALPQYRLWLMHGTTHWLGMNVHDVGGNEPLEPGMVFTNEPGVYVRADALEHLPRTPQAEKFRQAVRPAFEKYKNIGVRIEDDVLVTPEGSRNLSAALPRTLAEVESFIARARRQVRASARPRDGSRGAPIITSQKGRSGKAHR